MADDKQILVEVCYARPDKQLIIEVEVAAGTSAVEAVQRSGILDEFPEIDIGKNKIGIFGKIIKKDRVLHAGERVEIYRPLKADPKEVRRRLAAEGKSIGKRKR